MQIRTVRKPGEPGTRKLVDRYGDRLVSVRYRYDPAKGRCYKKVELIIAEEDWRPPPERITPPPAPPPKPRHTPRVPVRIQWNEKDLQRRAKAAGGLWDPRRKLWYVPEERVRQLGLAGRIVR
jgi:hypothetical protein